MQTRRWPYAYDTIDTEQYNCPAGNICGQISLLSLIHISTADYTADGMPRTLLMEYVRYARDSALDVFESNYLSMLLGMQNEKAVKNYEALSSVE